MIFAIIFIDLWAGAVLLAVLILVCCGESMFHQCSLIGIKNRLDYAWKCPNNSLNHELAVFDRFLANMAHFAVSVLMPKSLCKILTIDMIDMPEASANSRFFTFGSPNTMPWIFLIISAWTCVFCVNTTWILIIFYSVQDTIPLNGVAKISNRSKGNRRIGEERQVRCSTLCLHQFHINETNSNFFLPFTHYTFLLNFWYAFIRKQTVSVRISVWTKLMEQEGKNNTRL